MSRDVTPFRPDCARARRRIDALCDGEPVTAAERGWLDAHLDRCVDCAARAGELERLQVALRSIRLPAMPADAFAAVLSRTSRRRRFEWRVVAAAAALTLALVGLWRVTEPRHEVAPTRAELARAAAETRLVLGLTGRALRRTEQVALREVLGGEVADTLRRLPLRWPEQPVRSARERGKDAT